MVNHVFGKFHYYWHAAANNSIMSYWQSILFFSLTLLYAKFRMGIVYTFGIIFIIIYLVGPERVNMMAYCFFIFHALQINRGFNFGVIITSFYFAFKSLFFVIDILQTGQGFSRWSIL
jgi:hypothetical protein